MSGTSAPATPPRSAPSETPREPTWLQADSSLLARLDGMQREVENIVRGTMSGVMANALNPLVLIANTALERHRTIREEMPFFDSEGRDGPQDLWQRICRYRDAVSRDVIAPVREAVGEDVGAEITAALRAVVESAAGIGQDLPNDEILPELPGLFKPDKRDGPFRRSRKALARMRRHAAGVRLAVSNRTRRLLRAPLRPLPPRRRHVPIRDLAAYHVNVRVAGQLATLHRESIKNLTSRLASIESAVSVWTTEVLRTEAALDHATYHGPAVSWLHEPGDQALEESLAERIVDMNRAADALERGLTPLATAQAAEWFSAGDDALVTMSKGLLSDMQLAGTFLLDMRDRRSDAGRTRIDRGIEATSLRWKAFQREITARFELDGLLLSLRTLLIATADGLLRRITAAAVDPVLSTFGALIEGLRRERDRLDRAFSVADTDGVEKLTDTLMEVRDGLLDRVRRVQRDLPGLVTAEAELREPGVEEWAQVVRHIDALPERLDVHQRLPEGEADRRRRVIDIRIQDIARDALAPPLPVQVRDVAAALRQRVLAVWSRTEQIDDIIRYNLDATIDELTGAAQQEGDSAAAVTEAIRAGRELTTDGLDRSVATLVDLSATLEAPWTDFRRVTVESYQDDWADLHRRVQVDDFFEGRWVDLQFWVTRRLEASWRETRARWARGLGVARRGLGATQRFGLQLIRKGRTVVGVEAADETTLLTTIDQVVDVHRRREALPLVYRRLFSLTPVREAALLEGRARDLVRIRDHYRRWRDRHQAGVMIVTGSVGGGATSFLNTLDESVFGDCQVRRVALTGRVGSESELAASLAAALEVTLPAGAGLDALESALPDVAGKDSHLVCILEDVEHLVLQAPGGSNLLARALIFLSRADANVYWVASVSDQMWRFVDRTAGGASGFVTTMHLPAPDRALLEAIIVERHRRTGLPLHFNEPTDPSPILRQRLRRARTPERRQTVLRETFFDRLFRAAGPSVSLAIFYWIRSVEFVGDGESVEVRPLETLDFGFLNRFDLHQAFTLRAFVLHRTLTVGEHADIFRSTPQESTFALESLLNLRIIEPCESGGSTNGTPEEAHQRIVPGKRYRIRSLLRQPVVGHLKAKHIVY